MTGRCRAGSALADVFARDLHDRLARGDARDRFLHEGILELGGPDLAQREIEARGMQGRARRQPVPWDRLHAGSLPRQERMVNGNVRAPWIFAGFLAPFDASTFRSQYFGQRPLHVQGGAACAAVPPWKRFNELFALDDSYEHEA